MSVRAVWKWEIPPIDEEVVLSMPEAAEILHVDAQAGKPCVWALVDPSAPTEERRFHTVGTGHPFNPGEPLALRHRGTYQLYGGAFVGHIFEVLE